jgi:hypothetical protein
MAPEFRQELSIQNFSPNAITLCIEPWADEVSVPPQEVAFLTVRSPQAGYLEVVYEDRRVTVWAWACCRGSLRGRNDGLNLDFDIPAPDIPPFRKQRPTR